MSTLATEPTLERSNDARRPSRERRRALGRVVRRAALVLLIAAGAAGVLYALRPRPVPVEIARVARGPLEAAIEESGTARVKDRYVVSAPVAGSLARLRLEPGDPVREGDPVAEIAPAIPPLLDQRTKEEAEARLGAALSAMGQAKAQQARATAAKDMSGKDLERVKSLVSQGSLAAAALEEADFIDRMRGEELASAVFAGKVAGEEVRLARAALGRDAKATDRHIDVLAPVSGTVLEVHQKSAAPIAPGTPLVEIGDPAMLEVVVDLLTTDAVRVKLGTPVVIQGWGGDAKLAGKVHRIEPSAFTRPSALGVDEQRVNVVVALTDAREKWAALGDGYRVEARLVLWQAPDVLEVPLGAVFRHGEGWGAYVVDGAAARLVAVTVGHRGESDVEVLSGLAEGDQVIVHPGDRVKEGARVEAR